MSYVLFNIYMHYLIRKVLKRNSLYQKNICLFKKRNHIEKTAWCWVSREPKRYIFVDYFYSDNISCISFLFNPIQDELGGKEGPLPVFSL